MVLITNFILPAPKSSPRINGFLLEFRQDVVKYGVTLKSWSRVTVVKDPMMRENTGLAEGRLDRSISE